MPSSEQLWCRLKKRALLLDGGMGSMLIAQGLEAGKAPERWNLEFPDRIAAVHRAYSEAGCEIVHTNTFGASPAKLAEVGLEGRCREVCSIAVQLARDAVGPETFVAGDIGPTGLLFPPMGKTDEAEIERSLAEQVEALVDAGVDLLSIETMFDLREAQVAVRTASQSGLPVFASMTFNRKKRGFFTLLGNPLSASLQALVDTGADVVGSNCTLVPDDMIDLVAQAVQSVEVPIVAQPNAGEPIVGTAGVHYDTQPSDFAAGLARLVEKGARLVGGCCGTEPPHLQATRLALEISSQ